MTDETENKWKPADYDKGSNANHAVLSSYCHQTDQSAILTVRALLVGKEIHRTTRDWDQIKDKKKRLNCVSSLLLTEVSL